MRLFFGAVAALLCLSIPAMSSAATTMEQTQSQTFVVQTCYHGHQAQIGTAVVVARDRDTLTLATSDMAVRCNDLHILDLTQRAFYHVLDTRILASEHVALVRVSAQQEFPAVPAAFAQARVGEPVVIWGNHDGGFWLLSTGVVTATTPRITVSCDQCAPGDGGAGIFDQQGELLGILTRGLTSRPDDTTSYVEAAPSQAISAQIDLSNAAAAVSRP